MNDIIPFKAKRRYIIRHQFDSEYAGTVGEKNNQPSLTIPDQTMSIQEIMDRFARGLPIDGERVPVYEGEEDEGLPDMTHWDLAEKEEFLREAQEELNQVKQRIAAVQAAKQQKKDDQGPKSERTPVEEDDQGPTDQTDQYPKKTGGGGAQPPDTRKGGDQKKH